MRFNNEKLTELRVRNGWSFGEASARFFLYAGKQGITRQTWQKWEVGDNEPRATTVKLLGDFFGVDYGELFTEG